MRKIFPERKNIIRILFVTTLILMVPLVAMQFTDEVDWDITDFVTIGFLLIGTGLLYELIIKKVSRPRYRIVVGIVLLVVLLLTWVELAVGLFGTPFAGS